MHLLLPLTCLLVLLGCVGPPDDLLEPQAASWSERGPYTSAAISDAMLVGGRTVPVQVWYPSDAPEQTSATPLLVSDEVDRSTLAQLLLDAPDGCPSTEPEVAFGAAAASLSQPAALVVFSHCHTCLGLSGATIASPS